MYKLPSTDPQATRYPYHSDKLQPEEITTDHQQALKPLSTPQAQPMTSVALISPGAYDTVLLQIRSTSEKKFLHIYWYVTFSSQMRLNTEMLEVSQTSKGWIQRELVRLGKLFQYFPLSLAQHEMTCCGVTAGTSSIVLPLVISLVFYALISMAAKILSKRSMTQASSSSFPTKPLMSSAKCKLVIVLLPY